MHFTTELRDIRQFVQAGQFESALTKISQVQPAFDSFSIEDQQDYLYLKAVSLRYISDTDNALKCVNELIERCPEFARAHQEQGYCFLAQNQIEQALDSFHKAVELNPTLISAWQQIVNLFSEKRHPELGSVKKQLLSLTALPKPVLGAMDLMHEGKLHKAEQVCRNYLKHNKHQADAMCVLAEIGTKLKVFDDAEFLLESCVNLHPNHVNAKSAYINLLNRLGKFSQSVEQAEQFLEQFKQQGLLTFKVSASLAHGYLNLGKTSAAIKLYKTLLNQAPDKAAIQVQLGHAYKTLGDINNATNAYQQAVALKPFYGDAYYSLANIKTYRFSSNEINTMQLIVQTPEVKNEDKIHLYFALGKAFEDQQDFESSFKFYQQGNQLKKQSSFYSANKTSELINLQIQHCGKELFNQQANKGYQDTAPIFIVGLPRAGSTLIEQILASHSQVDGTMELHNILGLAMKLRGRIAESEPLYPKNLSSLTTELLYQFGQRYIQDTQCYRAGSAYFIDKMPNNFIHIGLIKLILPKAKIIDARREPMACCFSGYKQLFGDGQEFSYDLQDLAQYYQDYVRLMEHWHKVLPAQILTVQHENLVQNFEQEVRRILDYCQLPFDPNCLSFYENNRAVHTPSAQQVRQPIYTSGLEQWKNFQRYLTPLAEALVRP